MIVHDIAGVGIGPSNLSLAALLYPQQELSAVFMDRKPSFVWHNGMLMPEAGLQVSFLKDLVTLVDPTNPFTFLNFLKEEGRLYRHFMTRFPSIKRKEFNQYYNWAVGKMKNLHFNCDVQGIRFEQGHFTVRTSAATFYSRHLVIGVGLEPYIPSFATGLSGPDVFHSSEYLLNRSVCKQKRIAVIGGGQSGAEIVNNLLHAGAEAPRSISWITRRYNFLPIDDSPFTNELYTPGYSEFFYQLSPDIKDKLLDDQKLTSDGISQDTLQSIYNKLYELEVIEQRERKCHLHPGLEVKEISRCSDSWQIACNTMQQGSRLIDADIIIFATGYRHQLPAFMKSLPGAYRTGSQMVAMNDDFSIDWDGPAANRIFIQNGNKNIWGVPNPNLSLNAWRSARIINAIMQREYYELRQESSAFDWMMEDVTETDKRYLPVSK